MSSPKCLACRTEKFQMCQVTPEGSNFSYDAIQCATCLVIFGVVGTSVPSFSTEELDKKFETVTRRLDDFFMKVERELGEMRTVKEGLESLRKLFRRFFKDQG